MPSELWLGMWTGIATMLGMPTAAVAVFMSLFFALMFAAVVGLKFGREAGLVSYIVFLFLETLMLLVDWYVFGATALLFGLVVLVKGGGK